MFDIKDINIQNGQNTDSTSDQDISKNYQPQKAEKPGFRASGANEEELKKLAEDAASILKSMEETVNFTNEAPEAEATEEVKEAAPQKAGFATAAATQTPTDDLESAEVDPEKIMEDAVRAADETAEAVNKAKTEEEAKASSSTLDQAQANRECLEALARLFGVEELALESDMSNLTLVKGDFPADTLMIQGSDTKYLVTKDLIQAEDNMVSPKAAFEMALIAFNNPEIQKSGVDLQGNLLDRYMLQMAADLVKINITNRVTEQDIPAELKAEFERAAAEWASFVYVLENPVQAQDKTPEKSQDNIGASEELELEPYVSNRSYTDLEDSQEPTISAEYPESQQEVTAPTAKDVYNTKSSAVVDAIKKAQRETHDASVTAKKQTQTAAPTVH